MDRGDLKWGAIVAAILAGTAGVAEGARELFDGGDIKDGSLGTKELSSKARKALKGNRGPRGRQGLQGLQGLQGPPGVNGANGQNGNDGTNGQNGATGLTVVSLPLTLVNPNQFYGTGTSESPTESQVQFRVPVGLTQLRGLSVYGSPDATYTFTVRVNGQPTALTCGLTLSPPVKTCSSTGAVPVSADALIAIGVTGNGKGVFPLSTALTFAQ